MKVYRVGKYLFDLENAIKECFETRNPIYEYELNTKEEKEILRHYWSSEVEGGYLITLDHKFSELNPEDTKEKYKQWLLEEEIKENEKREQIERSKFHILVYSKYSNSEEYKYDKWVDTREDFEEVFKNKISLLVSKIDIIRKFATNEEILEILKYFVKHTRIIYSCEGFNRILKILDLCDERNIDYDIYYEKKFDDTYENITLPYFFLEASRCDYKDSLYKLINNYKFDLNKDILDGGALPFHTIDLLDDKEIVECIKCCINSGKYNVDTTETEMGLTIGEALIFAGKKEIYDELFNELC